MGDGKTTQTSIEAVIATLSLRGADYVPSFEMFWGDTRKKWVNQGLPPGEDGTGVDLLDHFSLDMGGYGNYLRWQAKEGGEIVEETDDWIIRRNGNGGALKSWKNKNGTPEHVDFHMTSRGIWEREYRPLLVERPVDRMIPIEDAEALIGRHRDHGRFATFGFTFIWEILRASLGDFTLYTAVYDDPGWIHDFNRVYTDLYKECFTALAKAGVKPDAIFIYEDFGYKDRLFISPDTYRELFFPYYTEIVDFYHGHDMPVLLHSCGYQEPVIPLVVEAGFDALNPMEVKAGNDIFKYAERYGDRLAFVGGLDERILETGDRELMRKSIGNFITGMRERGASFVYGSDHSISPNVDYDDYCYSLEVYRDLRRN